MTDVAGILKILRKEIVDTVGEDAGEEIDNIIHGIRFAETGNEEFDEMTEDGRLDDVLTLNLQCVDVMILNNAVRAQIEQCRAEKKWAMEEDGEAIQNTINQYREVKRELEKALKLVVPRQNQTEKKKKGRKKGGRHSRNQ